MDHTEPASPPDTAWLDRHAPSGCRLRLAKRRSRARSSRAFGQRRQDAQILGIQRGGAVAAVVMVKRLQGGGWIVDAVADHGKRLPWVETCRGCGRIGSGPAAEAGFGQALPGK